MLGPQAGGEMPFIITGDKPGGAARFDAATASNAIDKVLELETQGYQSIVVKDDGGRAVSRDELSSLCEAGED
jgi:hypothetical protein